MEKDDKLEKLQEVLIDMLSVFDSFCNDNRIRYSVYGGTALGAIRHKDMIPWDDDIDVCMSIDNYIRFQKIWEEKHLEGYIFQSCQNTPNYYQVFSKIRKNHTVFLEGLYQKDLYHTGIFIDLFVVLRIPQKQTDKFLLYFYVILYFLFSKKSEKGIKRGIYSLFNKILSNDQKSKLCNKIFNKLYEYSKKESCGEMILAGKEQFRMVFPVGFSTNTVRTSFRHIEVSISKEIDSVLKKLYGNYWMLPKEEDRVWKHHPIILDFEKDVSEVFIESINS